MNLRAKSLLNDMLERAEYLVAFAGSHSLDGQLQDRLARSSIERELMVLGEALYQLHERFPDLAQQIDSWEDIIAMRHKLVHGYSKIAAERMIDVIENYLQPLIDQLNEMIADDPPQIQ